MPFPLRVGTFANPSQREIDNTELVDYIIACLSKCNRVLTGDAESELSEIIGEVLANAEEHSSTKKRYVVGYFTYNPSDSDIVGTLNLTIFNFGDTIYQKFKDPDCPNQGVVKQMQALSEQYLTKGWFQNPLERIHGAGRGICDVRKRSQIDLLADSTKEVVIQVPDDIRSINPSFLEEFLYNVVQTLGRDAFYEQVKFDILGTRYNIKKDVDEAVDRILRKKNALAYFQ